MTKVLTEDDCDYLVEKEFKDWEKYLMFQHYRVELNINSHEPLPRIKEVSAENDGVLSDTDFREKFPPKDDQEKQSIE
jgi:hypothetical protein